MSKRLQRGDGSRFTFQVPSLFAVLFAHCKVWCFYGETCFEAQIEHLAAEVCEVCEVC